MARHVGTVHTETSKSIDEADEIKKAKLLGPEDADTMELRISDLTKKCTDIQTTGVEKEFRYAICWLLGGGGGGGGRVKLVGWCLGISC